ncbi:hypothetical protein AGLY_000460 [Aphis glycines]|uniref:Uncharacterized protein n=1 Tax=Aphis glycines TaxID=307491 RepID=A0A6G0U7J0_APHGL|nr:hypothetical protein AGLY_000460 [Aphis glycines]
MHTGASLSGTQSGGVSVDVDKTSLIMVSPLHTSASSPFSISITAAGFLSAIGRPLLIYIQTTDATIISHLNLARAFCRRNELSVDVLSVKLSSLSSADEVVQLEQLEHISCFLILKNDNHTIYHRHPFCITSTHIIYDTLIHIYLKNLRWFYTTTSRCIATARLQSANHHFRRSFSISASCLAQFPPTFCILGRDSSNNSDFIAGFCLTTTTTAAATLITSTMVGSSNSGVCLFSSVVVMTTTTITTTTSDTRWRLTPNRGRPVSLIVYCKLDGGHSVCVELLDTFGVAWSCLAGLSCDDGTFSLPLSSWTTTTTTAAPPPLFLPISRSIFVDFTKISVRASVAVASDSVRSASGIEPDDDSRPPQSYCCSCCRLPTEFFDSLSNCISTALFVDMIVDPKDPRLVDGLQRLLLLLIMSCGDDGGVGGNPFVPQCSIVVTGGAVVGVVLMLLSMTSSAVLDERHSESSSLVS